MEGWLAGPTGCLMKAGSERRAVGGGGSQTAEIGIPNVVKEEGRGAVGDTLLHSGPPPRDACIPKGSTRGKWMRVLVVAVERAVGGR